MVTTAEKETIDAAIMFADVAGSSELYKTVGDTQANATVSECVDMMMGEVKGQFGVVVKTIGDAVMARFDSTEQACAAAVDIQRTCNSEPDGLSIRIGMSFGTAILDDSDVFGEVVNDAAALSAIAKAQQILITQNFAENLKPDSGFDYHRFDKIKIKGSQTASVILRVDWEALTRTFSSTQVMHSNTIEGLYTQQVEFTYQESKIPVTAEDTPFVVGRDPRNCDLAIRTDSASRDHFHIVHRRGKFVLIDHSTNGTFVKVDDAPEIYLRREELPLRGKGIISLGNPIKPLDLQLLYFCCV